MCSRNRYCAEYAFVRKNGAASQHQLSVPQSPKVKYQIACVFEGDRPWVILSMYQGHKVAHVLGGLAKKAGNASSFMQEVI